MGGEWTMLSISKYFGARHSELLDAKLARYRAAARDSRMHAADRIEQLEDDLGRTLLLVQALAEACIAKGVLTRDELAAIAEQVDLSDGVSDGKLDLQTIRPPVVEGLGEESTTEEYLQKLEEESED